MKKSIWFILTLTLLSFSGFTKSSENGTLLEFKFKLDDKSRILSTVNEDVYINSRYSHTSEILNRITSEVTDIDDEGRGKCEAIFMTTETSTNDYSGSNFTYGQEYESAFWRDKTGKYEIEDIYFMPTVRDVPVFPDYPVKPGDTWKSEGHEAHDLRKTFNMAKPFKVPFEAEYTYLKDETDSQGNLLNVIRIEYQLYFKSPVSTLSGADRRFLPAVTKGFSNQLVWWNNKTGAIDHYSEEFRIGIETFSGDQFLFVGTAHAEVTDFQRSATEENISRISDTLKEMGIEDVDVKESEKGLTLSIENIQFEPDSSKLMPSEKEKLKKIAQILKKFDNDLLITGHCAKRGTDRAQRKISEDRAASVADFLTRLKVRDRKCIYSQGKGATEPVATNDTEEGRARNRRVEITLMDN